MVMCVCVCVQVEVTRFEELDETFAEVKLKQLVWDSQQDWERYFNEWMTVSSAFTFCKGISVSLTILLLALPWSQIPFDEFQPDTVHAQVTKFVKTVYQLEKGLPPNNVVPKLKKKVEAMKEKMPVIQDLRNPCLKSRHWDLIEDILQHNFDPEKTKTLKMLVDLNVFEYAEAIQEVSGQASSEASLEGILKKARKHS